MPFIKKLDQDFFIKDKRFFLNQSYVEKNINCFKKITGTRLAGILGLNKYSSPLKTWASMVNIYKDEIDPTLAKVGSIVECKVRDFVSNILNIKFRSYNPKDIAFDLFKDNKIFGGIPDGEPIDENGYISYKDNKPMLEIKTTSVDNFMYKKINNSLILLKDEFGYPIVKQKFAKKKLMFIKNEIQIPIEYQCQLMLYLHLRNVNFGIFAFAFLEKEDYKYPENFDPYKRDIHIVEMRIKNNTELLSLINYAQRWYKNYMINNTFSPKFSNLDEKWIEDELQISL